MRHSRAVGLFYLRMSDIRTKPSTPEYEETWENLKTAGEFGKTSDTLKCVLTNTAGNKRTYEFVQPKNVQVY